MKASAAILGLALLAAGVGRAQVSVELSFDQDSYLPHERCLGEIRITNFSGRPLKFSAESDWFDLNVESEDGYIVAKLADVPAAEEFEIPSAARGKRRVDLAPCFNLSEPGRYKVSVSVRLPQLNLDVLSNPVTINIMSGAPLWEQAVGVPGTGEGTVLEVRRYSLLQTNDRKRLALYVRVTDENERRVFRVFPLGGLLSFSRPDAQVDRQGRLHVLFQTGSRQYSYNQVSPDGELLIRQMHQIADARPRLRLVEGGQIKVSGGFRVKSSYDIPKPEDTDTPAARDASTNAPPVTPPVPGAPSTNAPAGQQPAGRPAPPVRPVPAPAEPKAE
jgi:hypothetical protein